MILSCLPGELGKKVGIVDEVKAEEVPLQNPRIEPDASMEAGQKVTYSCVWFGSYPQTEIVDKPETSGVYAKQFATGADYVVDIELYNTLQSETKWDINGDTVLPDGTKYRRVKKDDVVITEDTNTDGRYRWDNSVIYHYFRYDKIKWRVLNLSGNQAFLIADQALDYRPYNTFNDTYPRVTWETSSIRSWLNGYDESHNINGIDYSNKNFIDSAFSSEEQEAIETTLVVNNNNIEYQTDGGNDTYDKIFLLSESEAYTDSATAYGFIAGNKTDDEARWCRSSTYAKALGIYTISHSKFKGNCHWWMRSPGYNNSFATAMTLYGSIYGYGFELVRDLCATRPVLNLNLSYTDVYSFAGTICSDGTVNGGGEALIDTDNDSLPDAWEINGVDTDGDGTIDLHLEEMGADPNKPDIFVEVDWMVRPETKVLWITTEKEVSLKPRQSAMKEVYNSFAKEHINLHIDCGPDSVDFVTGKKWGELSGSNIIPYEGIFEIMDEYSHWNSVINSHFNRTRRNVFHHCIFAESIHVKSNGKDVYNTTGVSMGIPGQFFIVTNWATSLGDGGVTGTFMHELGHNLGLYHGGFNSDNIADDTFLYKPNYLSVMNYLYQTSGLFSTGTKAYRFDYSQVSLPDLNENYLLEGNGIDPFENTDEWEYGFKYEYTDNKGRIKTKCQYMHPRGIDYNCNNMIDQDPVVADINHDGVYSLLPNTTPDWPRLDFSGVDMSGGNSSAYGVGYESVNSEFSLDDALKHDLLAEEGVGILEALGPFTLLPDIDDQHIYLQVKNLGSADYEYTVDVEESDLTNPTSTKIQIPGSQDKIESVNLPIPIKANSVGDYTIRARLKSADRDDVVIDIPVTLYKPSAEEIKQIEKELPLVNTEGLASDVVKELSNIVQQSKKIYTGATEVSTQEKPAKVSNITVSGVSKKIAAGSKLSLLTTVLPENAANKTLKWTSSDTKVATVTQTGKVSIKKGTGGKSVTITATATDGSGVSASYKIKVMKGAVKKVTIKGAKKSLKVGKTMKLKAVVKTTKGKPVNKKVMWTSSNTKYATVSSSGKVKALKAGKGKTVKITATAMDGSGKKAVKKIKIK